MVSKKFHFRAYCYHTKNQNPNQAENEISIFFLGRMDRLVTHFAVTAHVLGLL